MIRRSRRMTVKCRLIAAARPAVKTNGKLAYSVFQQGAGLINAVAAVNSSATNCANRGLDIDADLAGTAHFGGPANQDDDGNYYVMDMAAARLGRPAGRRRLHLVAGLPWDQGYAWSEGYTWSRGYTWSTRLHLEQGLHLVAGLHLEHAATRGAADLPWWNSAAGSVPPAQPGLDRITGCRTSNVPKCDAVPVPRRAHSRRFLNVGQRAASAARRQSMARDTVTDARAPGVLALPCIVAGWLLRGIGAHRGRRPAAHAAST